MQQKVNAGGSNAQQCELGQTTGEDTRSGEGEGEWTGGRVGRAGDPHEPHRSVPCWRSAAAGSFGTSLGPRAAQGRDDTHPGRAWPGRGSNAPALYAGRKRSLGTA